MTDQRPEQQPRQQAADERERQKRSGQSAAAARIGNQATWVDQQIRVAMANGEFDDLPGRGKPIQGLGSHHDPDWWLKKLVEREQITVLPLTVQLRREDEALDETLDALTSEEKVRRHLDDFNKRVVAARYRAPEGPPLVTMPRDVDADVESWRARREARWAERERRTTQAAAAQPARRARWWRRG